MPQSPHGHNRRTKGRKSWNVKESTLKTETDSAERVDLNPYAFERLLDQKGVDCCVYRSMYCPKVKSVDGAEHEIDCNLCNGSGFVDLDPIDTRVFIHAQELDKLPHVEGFVDGNTVMMTFPIGIELQYFTRIDLKEFTDIFFQRVLRNPDSNTDVLKYRACRVNVLMDYDGVRYYEGTDFRIDSNGNILWVDASQTRTITFSDMPDAGSWTLTYGSTTVGTYTFTTIAADLQTDLRTATGFNSLTVTGNFASGFVVTFVGANALLEDLAVSSSSLTESGTAVTVALEQDLVGGRHPENNIPYSIHYEANQRFRAAAAAHVNRFTQITSTNGVEFIKLPEQWYCSKEFFPKRTDRDGNELQQGPYDAHEIVEED